MNEVYIMSATRSPVGAFGGSLKDFDPVDLGAIVAKESIKRSNISSEEIGHAVFGNVIHTLSPLGTNQKSFSLDADAVSYTHLTLPTKA